MASFPKMRLQRRSALAERVRVLRHRPLAIAATLAVAALAAAALSELAALQGSNAASHTATPAFLTRALGAARPNATLVRTPAPPVAVEIAKGGLTVADSSGAVHLASTTASSASWHRHVHGALRRSSVGSEAILFDDQGQGAESFLVVDRHQGKRTWRWRLDTTYTPRVTRAGVVGFYDGRKRAPQWIPAVQIVDAHEHDVTPHGLTWSTVRTAGTWWLELRLDDRKLALPYTIDPAVLRTGGA